jgi:hypothetical protein
MQRRTAPILHTVNSKAGLKKRSFFPYIANVTPNLTDSAYCKFEDTFGKAFVLFYALQA